MRRWAASSIAERLDFSCNGVFGPPNPALVGLQQEGVYRIANILRRDDGVAYLADEVGLGKTMQAFGVISCLFADHPEARVLIITPREGVQNGWKNESLRFNEHVAREPLPTTQRFDNLRTWLRAFEDGPSISLLRHSSFTRPVYQSDLAWPAATAKLELPAIPFRANVSAAAGSASWDYNLAFAQDVNKWLTRQSARFDLVVVDEAQCLRNIERQQTNNVLMGLLKNRVDRWLFLSATPAHSGIDNISTVLNRYPSPGELVSVKGTHEENGAALRQALKRFMVRRPRTFTVGKDVIHKHQYRNNDHDKLALHCHGTLDTLSIALVQKHLVNHFGAGDGFRFRTGFIASFESLEDSLKHRALPQRNSTEGESEGEETEEGSDFAHEREMAAQGQAPDEEFVTQISRDFADRFGIGLPHPKMDGVAQELAASAWGNGTESQPGGIKTVVFCRRLSSVRILRERLMKQYLSGIEQRCETAWSCTLDWEKGLTPREGELSHLDHILDAVPEDQDEMDDSLNRLRQAQLPGKWLHNFRSSFYDGQRNAHFFELNWFRWLCAIRGVDPHAAAQSVPDDVWSESVIAATRADKRYRRGQSRYLVWRCLEQHSSLVFQLDDAQAKPLIDALRPVLCDEGAQARVAASLRATEPVPRDDHLLLFDSLWTRVESLNLLNLPAMSGQFSIETIRWRKIVATVLSQYARLTDALIDLRCSEINGLNAKSSMLDHFVAWLEAGSPEASRMLQHWRDWCERYRLIFSSAVGDLAAQHPEALAKLNTFTFLNNIDPVVAITGGTGGHKTAICQFNTPGMPYVMLGTDTIREGVNLHLFCDRVMHYGLPWTAGDLEQRIGRVDRYFGKIERRLHREGLAAQLEITYPHLNDTLEARQIDNLRIQLEKVAAVMDDDLFSSRYSEGQFVEVDGAVRTLQGVR